MVPSAATTSCDTACRLSISCAILSVALPAWRARFFTSLATTAKPLPASPARADSIVAFNASRLICPAMSRISPMTPTIDCDIADSFWIA